jgi:hypothetical protein
MGLIFTPEQSLDDDASTAHASEPSGWSAIEAAGLAACALDADLRYRRVNAAWHRYLQGDTFRFGRQPVNMDGRSLLADLPEERRARWAPALAAILDGTRGHFIDHATESSTLGNRQIVTTAIPLLDAAGAIDGILCVRYDLTGAQQTLANEERLIQVLLTARRLQHFLGNQLALTLGYVELLTFDPRLPEELRDRLDEALRGVLEATETLSKLRLVTRLELDHDDQSIIEYLGPAQAP